jgi:hypothetical protein
MVNLRTHSASQTRLDTDAFGRVRLYEGLWIAELAVPE